MTVGSRVNAMFASDTEIAFNADIVARPDITSIDPTSGPLGHGISVMIRAHDFQ